MANLEIERKFLLKTLPNIEPTDSIKIEQLYLKKNGVWERVRSWESSSTGRKKWIHTIKTSVSKGINLEDEHKITEKEFESFKSDCLNSALESRRIFKTRHTYEHNNLIWEVDEFHNGYKLIVAEIEIPKKDFKIEIPKWISDLILLEVTGLKQFSNRSLSLKIR